MATVSVSINGRSYQLACDDGQEAHVAALAAYADGRARQLVGAVGQVGESMLLAMLCLLLADEVTEARAEVDRHNRGDDHEAADAALANGLDLLAQRIDGIANRLEKA